MQDGQILIALRPKSAGHPSYRYSREPLQHAADFRGRQALHRDAVYYRTDRKCHATIADLRTERRILQRVHTVIDAIDTNQVQCLVCVFWGVLLPHIAMHCEVAHGQLLQTFGQWFVAIKKSAKVSSVSRQTSLSSEGFFEPFSIDQVPWQRLRGSTAFKRLGRYGGGSQVGVGLDVLKAGRFSNRFHYHMREEEHIFILKGSATLVLGNRKYLMKERDYCCFPAGQKAGHHLFNHTKADCVFMTIGDNKPDDIACFPKTGNAKLRISGKSVPISQV